MRVASLFASFSSQHLSQSLGKELHIMPQKFPHSEQNKVLSSTFPAGKRNCICHPAFPSRTKGAFCSLPFTYSFRMEKMLPFLSWEALLEQHLDIHCLQESLCQQKENGALPEACFLLKTFQHSPSLP